MPTVSVIMGVYNINNEEMLKTSIDSILNQTYKDFEFIICDDGSTDKTYEILKKISKKDKRIKLIQNQFNMKAGGARNHCLELATGEFIAIMDADDYCDPQRLEEQVIFLAKNEEYYFVGCKGGYFKDKVEELKGEYWFCKYPQKQDFLVTLPFVHASIMFRKDILLEQGGYCLDKKVIRSEDYDLLMRLYTQGYRGANLESLLYYIREDEDTFKRRKYRYRINEMIVKYQGFKRLNLMPKGIIFAIKPLIIGLIPIQILNKIKNKYYKKKRMNS